MNAHTGSNWVDRTRKAEKENARLIEINAELVAALLRISADAHHHRELYTQGSHGYNAIEVFGVIARAALSKAQP
jgi:hypothetical protein